MDHLQPSVSTATAGAAPIWDSKAWYASLQSARPLLVVISGPSGVGKDVTIRKMKERQ